MYLGIGNGGSGIEDDSQEPNPKNQKTKTDTMDLGVDNENKDLLNIVGGNNEQYQELQGFKSVAGSNEPNNNGLQTNTEFSEGGIICSDNSNQKSSSINSLKYSGRSCSVSQERISLSSISSVGLVSRIGNTNGNSSQSELHSEGTTNSCFDSNSKIRSNAWSVSKSSSDIGNGSSVLGNRDLGIEDDNQEPNPKNLKPKTDTMDLGIGNGGSGIESEPPTPNPKPQKPITKWDIFYYIYAVLHKKEYKEKYTANLRRSLPRIPLYGVRDLGIGNRDLGIENELQAPNPKNPTPKTDTEVFWKYADAGRKLADLHINYEAKEEYPLTKIENPNKKLDWRVEKMHLSKDKQTLIYNDFLSLTGIPYEAFEYKLGNRSALEWIIDQYRVKTDERSGIVNDPNREDEPDYIIKLIGKIITISIETMKIVNEL